MKFNDWITKKYIEWRGDAVGNARTITDFSEWIGVSQSVMSYWMKRDGKIPRTQKLISKIAERYPEVYDVLGLTPPSLLAGKVPDRLLVTLEGALREIELAIEEHNIPINSPEAEKISKEILERRGFIFKEKDKEG
jgi:hypothetical protein